MKRRRAALALAVLLGGCGYTWGIEHAPLIGGPGPRSRWMRVDAGARYDVDVHLPRDARGPIPFVIVLHGAGGTGPGMERRTRFSELADSAGAAVAYPNALKSEGGRRLWGTAASFATDTMMLRALIDSVSRRVPLDRRRVYLAGFSNGGGMTYRAAQAMPGVFAALGVVAGGAGPAGARGGVPPVPLLAIHGMRDETVPFDGRGARGSAPSNVAAWARRNDCALPPVVDTLDQGETIRTTYGACADGADVVLYALARGGHGWPNADTPGARFPTTAVLWRFFVSHQRP